MSHSSTIVVLFERSHAVGRNPNGARWLCWWDLRENSVRNIFCQRLVVSTLPVYTRATNTVCVYIYHIKQKLNCCHPSESNFTGISCKIVENAADRFSAQFGLADWNLRTIPHHQKQPSALSDNCASAKYSYGAERYRGILPNTSHITQLPWTADYSSKCSVCEIRIIIGKFLFNLRYEWWWWYLCWSGNGNFVFHHNMAEFCMCVSVSSHTHTYTRTLSLPLSLHSYSSLQMCERNIEL